MNPKMSAIAALLVSALAPAQAQGIRTEKNISLVPIRAGAEVVGAVGVAGAPRGVFDEQCALAGIDRVKDQLK